MATKRALSRMLGVLVAAVLPLLPAAPAEAAVSAVKISDTQLDARALYFVSYDGLVNNDSFQQSGIFGYAGYQYAAWYTADRSAVLARRAGAAGAWQTVVLPHKLTVDDSHNVISMGVSPEDGRLHVAMDTHGNQVYYVQSVAGLLSAPASHAWTSSAFGAVQRTLNGVDLGAITYPQFVVTPERKLQLGYRTGASGNGTNELAEYSAGSWRKLGKWSSATGSWTSGNGVTSTTRNMYLHGITYGPGGRLHAAFTWREGGSGVLCNSGGLANHDTGYVYSDDRGRTWRNNAGTAVATTGGTPVAVSSPGTVVDPLGVDHALMNQESQAVDSAGQPHVVISYVPGRFTQCVTNYSAQRKQYGRTFFLSRAVDGTWTKREVPVAPESTQRTKLVFDRGDNAYLVMPYGRIVAATKTSGWTDWKTVYSPDLQAFGEVDVDDSRLATDGVLSVMYQQVSTGTTPSPIRVADFRLG
ncbi:BNR repeat-containing protein [Amycolatopsis sp. NPDC051045]|uniref:BNR repeat-containing protein n=1 Tax=Amycolatopsis sp. NPDC051045 TaxID=3156922 RepID=UPI00343312A8